MFWYFGSMRFGSIHKLASRSLVVAAVALSVGCAGPTTVVNRAAAETGPLVDDSMLPLCLKVLAGDASLRRDLAAHPLARKMSEGMREEVGFTPEEFAAAAFSPVDDARFSWRRLRDNARFVTPFAQRGPAWLAAALPRDLASANEFVSTSLQPIDVVVHLVCGGPWDAYVLYFDRRAELFLDLGWHADAEFDAVLPDVEAIFIHELWHIAFGEHVREHWMKDYKHSGDTAALLIYEMVDEGVGHYYSMRPHLYPANTIESFVDKQAGVFALLGSSYTALLAERDEKKRNEMLWHSHAGVPFWEKWGAVTGALIVHHLVDAIGRDGVNALLSEEPFSVLLSYDEQCSAHPDWPRLPPALVKDACALKESL